MAAPYIGNQDYRGYLNYLSKGSPGPTATQAGSLLKYGVGNDSGFANTGGLSQELLNNNQGLYRSYQQLNGGSQMGYNPSANILGQFGSSAAVAAPNWDLNAIYKQAGSQAAGQVNPYYTKQLQEFQTNQASAKALQDQQRQLQLENLTNSYNNTLAANDISQQRTAADTLQNEQQIGQQADYRQQDQGQQFDQARIQQAKDLATSGLTGNGLGNQQTLQSQTTRNTQEARQGVQDQQQVAAQELNKARTFEDLARSNVLAGQNKAQGEKQSQIDWDKFVQGQTQDLSSYKNQAEQERLGRLSTIQKQLAQQRVNSMIHALSNPAQRAAAAQTYAGAF